MKTKSLASVLAWVALLACTAVGVQAQSTPTSPPKGPEVVVSQFVDAWNAHDMKVFDDLITTDADWVTASGSRLSGREKIRAYLAEEHATWARTTRMAASNAYVRHLNRSTAMVFFEWQITSTKEGDSAKPRHGNNLFVVRQFGPGWIIAAGQVARRAD